MVCNAIQLVNRRRKKNQYTSLVEIDIIVHSETIIGQIVAISILRLNHNMIEKAHKFNSINFDLMSKSRTHWFTRQTIGFWAIWSRWIGENWRLIENKRANLIVFDGGASLSFRGNQMKRKKRVSRWCDNKRLKVILMVKVNTTTKLGKLLKTKTTSHTHTHKWMYNYCVPDIRFVINFNVNHFT